MNPPSQRILVVEDNPVNSLLAEKILRHYGYEVIVHESGEKALTWCQQNTAHLVLMDLSLPGMDGLDTTRQLRQLPGWDATPIVAVSAFPQSVWQDQCRDAGCNSFLSKPLAPKKLIECVRCRLEQEAD